MSRMLTRGILAALLLGATSSGHAQEKPWEKATRSFAKLKRQDGAQVDSAQLEIIEGHAELSDSGFVKISGEVRNKTGGWIRNPRVFVELLDESGKPMSVSSTPMDGQKEPGEARPLDGVVASRTFVPPGESTVFQYIRDARKIQGRYAGKHRLSATARFTTRALSVTIEGLTTSKGPGDSLTASGTIKNSGPQECRSPTVVIGIYRADGKLYTTRAQSPLSYFQKMLPPGQAVDFQLKGLDNPGGNATLKAWADCQFLD
jgi:hypothetical protein